MKEEITVGNKGIKVRSDCFVTYIPDAGRHLEIRVESRVKILFGKAIEAQAREVFGFFQIENGTVLIEDSGALDYVLAARMEACIKQVITTNNNFLPEMLECNRYDTVKKRLRMSRLYVPGNTPKMIINAGIHKPHGVILDLEDSVAVAKKDEARILVRNALRQVDFYGAERMVRINQLPLGLTDLEELVPHNLHVVLIPKCESALDIKEVNDTIGRLQQGQSSSQEIFLIPIIESARGFLNAEKIAAAADNIAALSIGLEDYAADLGVKRSQEGTESLYARSYLVNVCKAYGIQAIDSAYTDIANKEGLKETALHSKSLGFDGMSCIHPNQIRIVHDSYSPGEGEIAKAKTIVRAFEEAEEKGLGVVSVNSKMIDAPVVEQAKQTIASAISLGRLTEDWRQDHE